VTLQLSIIVPMLNEAGMIVSTLDTLKSLRTEGHEVIAVDGGSQDDTVLLCDGLADRVVTAIQGRAQQMNAGALRAVGEVLVFLHADTNLPANAAALIHQALASGAQWGRFDVRIAGRSRWFPVIAALMNFRSRWSGIATGDQAIFVRSDLFFRIGGFLSQPLLEDIEISKRLLTHSRPACLRQYVVTSGRRWECNGVWRTILLMWQLRWRYWRGEAAEKLAQAYS
jgi:rSAM/selenodomain-associated transferase 2